MLSRIIHPADLDECLGVEPVTVEVHIGRAIVRGILTGVKTTGAFDVYVPDAPDHKQERVFFIDEVTVFVEVN